MSIRLTELSKGSGCGCKIAPAILDEILKGSGSATVNEKLLVGFETKDDAAVWEINDDLLLISTTDFFTPIVDDPFSFGRIAAANALSDVYAMGGKPSLALAILGFPVENLPLSIAQEVIRGAKAICNEAGVSLAGGHSINLEEPVFGLAVNGFVSKKNLKKNNTAKAGDIIFLTKPIGTGIISAAHKKNKVEEIDLQQAIKIMSTLNISGIYLGTKSGVTSMTDITGFGLLGHLIEMCDGSNVSANLNYKNVPLIPGIEKYTEQFIFPDNTYRNWNSFEKKVSGINGPEFITLCDPQTSGGILFTVRTEEKNNIIALAGENNFQVYEIGKMTDKEKVTVKVTV